MKVTIDNINTIEYFYGDNPLVKKTLINRGLLASLLLDIAELNNQIDERKHIYIDYENEHTEYSPERTDPCPDYYGLFTLRFENKPSETVGGIMDLNELDTVLCALVNFIEFGR
jgi:hypothetical protein